LDFLTPQGEVDQLKWNLNQLVLNWWPGQMSGSARFQGATPRTWGLTQSDDGLKTAKIYKNGENQLRTFNCVFEKFGVCFGFDWSYWTQKKQKCFGTPLGAQKLGMLETKMTRNLQFPKKAG